MAKQLNVNLAMTADTSKAKIELQALQKQLDNLMMSAQRKDSSLGLSSEIQKATQMAAQLKVQLESATSSTGKLDLTKFNEGLQKSGLKLSDYRAALSSLGPEGSQAFSKLASSIMQAEVPLRRSNALLSNFATTLKNTARWQISSSVLHGFMGALQGAYGYAQDLNESLNNIRIVTGQSIDQMAKFADEANRAAKALSASTTAYTDAALIYYQQGLNDQAVKERTDVTIKLSNVSRQSAEEVSSQMTAIWNNFDDGSKKLEYYADVITKLGAATAASSSEISDGLQKFASVADTVGLSYEKATAALATVVAETRQSADVVGTAFKTMFARFQGLQLGETLEDGVTLNKYSEAINTVGVNILKANGDLKDMDTILDELGEKWNSIGEAQKVALAETVAGTRQYAQFMAIMNNYDKILANQKLAAGAEGTLQEQADIYAESWEAARKRVRVASQAIYQDLLDDKFFIKLLNWLEKTLSFLDKFIDNIGGLKGVLLVLGNVLTSVFSTQIQTSINNMVSSIAMMTPKGQKSAESLRAQANKELFAMTNSPELQGTAQGGAMTEAYKQQANLQGILLDNAKYMTEEEQKQAQLLLDMNRQMGEEAIAAGKTADELKRQTNELGKQQSEQARRTAAAKNKSYSAEDIQQYQNEIKKMTTSMAAASSATAAFESITKKIPQNLDLSSKESQELYNNLKQIGATEMPALESLKGTLLDSKNQDLIGNLDQAFRDLGSSINTLDGPEAFQNIIDRIKQLSSELKQALPVDLQIQLEDMEGKLAAAYQKSGQSAAEASNSAGQFTDSCHRSAQAAQDASDKTAQLGNSAQQTGEKLKALGQYSFNFGSVMSTLSSTIMGVATAINAIKNLGNIFNNDDLTLGEQILQVMMSFGMVLPMLSNMTKIQTMLNGLLSTSIVAVEVPLAAVYGIIIAIVAVGYGLVKLFEHIKAASPEGQLKKLKEQQEGLTKATEEARQEWEKFQRALSDYDEGLEGLKKLTKGTNEFNDQLKQVNDTAEEIIKTLSLVFGQDYYFDENGAKVFTQTGQNKINQGNQTIARGDQSLSWVGLQQQNKSQKLQYEATTGATADEREAYARDRSYKALKDEYAVINENKSLYENLYRDIKGYLKDIDEDFTLDDVIGELSKTYQDSINFETTDFPGLVNSIADIVNNVQDVVNTPFQFDYNQEQAWIANQLDSSNPYAQLIAQQQFKNQEEVEQYRLDTLMHYNNILKEEDINKEWENLFGALADKGASILEESGLSKEDYLAEYKVGQHYLELAQATLNEASKIQFSNKNKDILTNILTGNLEKISPEQMNGFDISSLGDDLQDFEQLWILLHGEMKSSAEEYLQHIKDQEYNEDNFYRTQIKGLDSLKESMANYNKELKSLKLGDTISPEVFAILSENAKTYFTLMEDGTYRLIGNAQQLQDVLFKENTIGFENDLQTYQNIKDNGYNEIQIGPNGQYASEYHGGLTPEEQQAMQDTAIGYAMATETLEQLNYVKQRFNEIGIDTKTQVLAENAALQDLATKYESCTDDLEAYQHALGTENQQLIANAKATLEYSIRVAELAEKHGFNAKETEAYAKRLKNNLAPSYKDANFSVQQMEKAALKAAISNQRLDRGLLNLNKNLDTYKKSLSSADKNSIEWSNTMDALKTDLADIVDMDISVLTDEFAESFLTNANNANILTQALDGNVEAIKTLREMAAQDMILNIASNLKEAEGDAEEFMSLWEELKAKMGETLTAGDIDQTELINAFNDLIKKGHMTRDEIEAALSGLHVAADIETQYHEQEMQVPTTVTETYSEPGGEIPYEYVDDTGEKHTGTYKTWRKVTATYEGPPVTVKGYVPTYSIKGTTGPGSSSSKVVSGNGPHLSPNSGKAKANSNFNARFIDDQGNTATPFSSAESASTEPVVVRGFEPVNNEEAIVPSYSSTTTGIKDNEKDKGGGSEKEPTKAAELIEDEEHRYDELNKTLEGLTQQFERLGKARERAWGKNKITLLEQEITKLKQMQQVYERYLKTVAGDDWDNLSKVLQSGGNLGAIIASGKAGGNLQKDFNKIVSSVVGAIQYKIKDENGNESRQIEDWKGLKDVLGIDFDLMLDEFGQIANRDEIEEAIESWWNKNVETWNNMTAADQEKNSSYWDRLSAIKEYMQKLLNQYDESINTFTEQSDKLLDNLYEQQAKVYEHFRYKVDLKVEISERSLKRIEYAIKVLGDNIYKVPEVMRSWFDKRVTDTKAEVINQGSTWASAYQEAQSLYSSGQISQEDYVQTIKDAQDGLYGCVDALLEINEEMREYYKNVLSKVKDEMSRITNEMDHQLSTVQHLTNVLSLLGRQTDYEAIGKILDAQLQMSRNGYEVSKAQTEMYRRQVADAEATLQELLADGISEAALEEWKNAVLYPAKEALLEAESEMQADFEAYLEVINSIYENRINQIYQDSERRLSGAWGSFDQVNNALERQHALDDEYLTKTNQIYETNVLIKKLAQDLDKTNNDAAKLRIKNFSAEIEGLQQKNKLSKSELDIAKARYEVLLAEIALEDARNAKSTVRLQRDNEGNYGYVYTADGEQVDAAEDDLAKKNNDLYNLVLGQANDYTQKIIQLTQERNAALKDLDMAWAEGRIADEETYNKLREDINNKYNALIQEDYESYYRALYWLDQTAVTDHTEAWGTSFQDILDAGEDFQSETDTLMHETGEAIDWLNGIRAEATEEAKVGAGDLEEQLKDLTDQNDALAKTMIEEVIPASEETLTMAQALTEEWIRQYDEIMALIDAYLQLIDAMNAALNEMAGVNKEEFDANKDYSLAATQKFLEIGVIDNDVIQQLLFRAQKEELNGGHNDKWWTNDQILELMDIASRGDNDARSADAMAFLQGIAGVNGDQQYYTSDRLAELGITGEGYSLEEFAKRLEENTAAQTEANRLAEEAKAQAESAQEATEESTEKTDENTEQSANTAQSIQDTAAAITEDFQTLANETTGHFDETIQGTESIIKENSNNLINALNQNANVVSAAVQAAAQVIALSISQAAEYASRAEAAAAEAQAAVAESIGGADGLASGGYTGAWGSGGKLAVLHEKELVLNANDTENILSAISLVRDFASAIDLRAAASNISTGLSSPAYEAGSQTLEQSVTIHAEFPNATNHSEIEEAFSNLVNRASQYANRL